MSTFLLLAAGLVSYGMFVQGIIWTWKGSRGKVVATAPFRPGMVPLPVKAGVLYAIRFVGGWSIAGKPELLMHIKRPGEGKPIPLDRAPVPFRTRSRGRRSIEYAYFRVERAGQVQLAIGSTAGVHMRRSQLFFSKISTSTIPSDELTIEVKEAISWSKRSLGILFLVLGANGAAWCTVLLIVPASFV